MMIPAMPRTGGSTSPTNMNVQNTMVLATSLTRPAVVVAGKGKPSTAPGPSRTSLVIAIVLSEKGAAPLPQGQKDAPPENGRVTMKLQGAMQK